MRLLTVTALFCLLVGPSTAWGQSTERDSEGTSASAEAATSAEANGEDSSGEEEAEPAFSGDFEFGSYGRARIDFDSEGNRGRVPNVVSHGPRLFEPSYAELDLRYDITSRDGFEATVLTTLALFEPLAHFSGNFGDQRLAVRNLYTRIRNFVPGVDGLSIWAGSRMFRGDDVYLLDWWPLDNLNTVGGGITHRWRGLETRLHLGVNRLDDPFQHQTIETPRNGYGTSEKVVLDRQRMIGSLRVGYTLPEIVDDFGAKALLYGEYHRIPSGERIPPELIEDDAPVYPTEDTAVELPSERGYVLGAQLGAFETGTANHLNLFFRHARGLAAYGEFGIPYGTNTQRSAAGATEWLGAISANWESEWVGVLTGAYLRRFTDADRELDDPDDYLEGAVVARPTVYITDHLHQAVEASYQQKYPFGVGIESGQHEVPEIFQLSFIEIVGLDRGSYQRPQIRLSYTISWSNQAARDIYPVGDARRPEPTEHIFSFGAEWWFNSSTY